MHGVPAHYVSLALLGIVLVGVGVARYFLGIDLLPEVWRFDGYWIICIAVGVLLTIPVARSRR